MASLRTAAVICAVTGALLYINTLDCGLCYDDETAIAKNQDLRPQTPWVNLVLNDFWGVPMHSNESHKSYRPLCVATFRLNYLLHELQPMGYHLVNVLLHSAVCYLYVQLCGVIFSAVWPALIAGLLFAVHPIHTEAVAGVVGRADVLAGLFFLVSLLSYKNATIYPSSKWLAVSILFCLCSALSKEQGITVTAVCLIYDVFVFQKVDIRSTLKQFFFTRMHTKQRVQKPVSQFLRRCFILAAFTVGFMVFRLKIMKKQPVLPITMNPAMTLGAPYRQLHWAYLSFYNSWLLAVPSQLSAEYAMSTIPLITSLSDTRNLTTLAFFMVIISLMLFGLEGNKQKQRTISFGISLVALSYLPASNLFFPVGFVIAERILYLPSMGFCMLVGYGAWHATKHSSKIISYAMKTGLVYLVVVHSTKTLLRNRDWYSEFTLYHSAVCTMPNNGKMLHNLAAEYSTKDISTAQKLMRAAIEVEPNFIRAYSDLGSLLTKQERVKEAEKMFRVAIDLVKRGMGGDTSVPVELRNLNAYTRLARLLKENSSRLEEAYKLCQTAISIRPTLPIAHSEMGDILRRMNKLPEAKEALDKALRINWANPNAHIAMGLVSRELGDRVKAEQSLRAALSLTKNNPSPTTMFQLASVLEESKELTKLQEAEEILLGILSSTPTSTDAAYTLGLVYQDLKVPHEAKEMFLRTLQLDPKHKQAKTQLASLQN